MGARSSNARILLGAMCGLLLCATTVDAAPTPRLAILVTRDTQTAVQLLALDAEARPPTAPMTTLGAPIPHAPDAVVRGAIVDAQTVLVAAEEARGPDRSFSGALWRVDEHGSTHLLDGLAYASRPLVIGRRAYLQIGRPGGYREAGVLRDDELALTELDLDSGLVRVVLRLRGQLTYPIGIQDGELLAYLLGPPGSQGDGGRLVAIGLSSGAVRDLGVIGVARDLSLVSRLEAAPGLGPVIVYEGRQAGARAIFARALDGRQVCLRQGDQRALSPVVTPSGVLRTATSATAGHPRIDVARVASDSGWLVAQRHLVDEALPRLVVSLHGREALVPAAPGERLEPIGLLPEAR